MRHGVDGRKFGRKTQHRVSMLRNIANAVIVDEQIVTTVEKAKEAKRVVDRLVTLAKAGTLHSRRLTFDRTRNEAVVAKLFDTLAARYEKRSGGYTRVLRLSDRRWGDAAEMAVLEMVDHPEIDRKKKVKAVGTTEATAEDAAKAASAPQDPFGRFRKMFSGRSKVGGTKTPRAKPAKSAASKKSPSGSSKSGGSSS